MKRFHYDKETGLGYLIKNNDIDGKPTIKIAFKVKKNKMEEMLNLRKCLELQLQSIIHLLHK